MMSSDVSRTSMSIRRMKRVSLRQCVRIVARSVNVIARGVAAGAVHFVPAVVLATEGPPATGDAPGASSAAADAAATMPSANPECSRYARRDDSHAVRTRASACWWNAPVALSTSPRCPACRAENSSSDDVTAESTRYRRRRDVSYATSCSSFRTAYNTECDTMRREERSVAVRRKRARRMVRRQRTTTRRFANSWKNARDARMW